MSGQELLLTLVGLLTVAAGPGLLGAASGMRRDRRLVTASMVAAVISLLWAVYWAVLAQPHHTKHAVLFVVLAVVCLIGASFARSSETV